MINRKKHKMKKAKVTSTALVPTGSDSPSNPIADEAGKKAFQLDRATPSEPVIEASIDQYVSKVTKEDLIRREGYRKIGMAPLIKPKNMKAGFKLEGYLVKVTPSTRSDIKAPILTIELTTPPEAVGVEVAVPAVHTIGEAVGNTVEAASKMIGHHLVLVKMGKSADKIGTDGQLVRHGAHIFDVQVSESTRLDVSSKKRK